LPPLEANTTFPLVVVVVVVVAVAGVEVATAPAWSAAATPVCVRGCVFG